MVLTNYLSNLVEHDELIVFTDAYDTLFIRGQQYIEQTYAGFHKPIVFSAEPNSWPLGVVGLALDNCPPVGRHPYLNSGGFIGVAGDILRLCTKYDEPPSNRFDLLERLRAHGYDTDRKFGWSDQYYWTLVRLLEADSIGLDHDASLFEYHGPPITDVVYSEVMRDVQEFQELGAASASYRHERARLGIRLQAPSQAAQVHFASSVTKAVTLDLLEAGELPGWLTTAHEPTSSGSHNIQVHRI